MVRFPFAHVEFAALSQSALYWPAQRALIVADLHLEKASWFARFGQMLPPYDSEATLGEVAELLEITRAKTLYCLGDSFHDKHGCERLSFTAQAQLRAMTAVTDWVWIAGNHDAGMIDHCGGRVIDEVVVDGVVLRHEAQPDEPRPELSGHFHPKLRVRARGRQVARRCFVMSATKLILPAFGSLTGGLDAHHPEIVRAVGRQARALVPVQDRMLSFPLAA
ncbi:MAG TPA: ligase-associated DNA damage response endonuclease PdeM [Sphingomonas sp.]|nr:ligase-associated DNA damage response endonuclease PdeM [Sphingomonas sp.]